MSAKRVMTDYYTKVRWRLGQLDQQLAELDEPLKASTGVAADSRKKIEKAVGEAHLRVATLLNLVEQLEKTALDVVDLQRRLKEETRNLIKPLKRLDGLVSDRERVTDAALNSWLLDLEEVAQLAAGALFPTGAKGLERVNDVLLQKLRPLVAFDFKRLLDKQQRKNSWTDAHARAVESARVEIEKPFLNLNAFLNRLAIEPMTATPVSRAVRTQHAAMRALEERLGALREDKPLRAFRGLLGDVRSIVRDVCEGLLKLEVPIYPTWEQLGAVQPLIDKALYDELSGVQKFALLNITSRMQSIEVDSRNLLDPSFKIKIWVVFSDRIYFRANASLVTEVKKDTSQFASAPAGLHRFNADSRKQKAPSKGGLQFSYAPDPDVPPKARRVSVDADIDLFRRPLSHLFGEVLVNHLTGSKTSQFAVHRLLQDQNVPPVGAFTVLQTSSLV